MIVAAIQHDIVWEQPAENFARLAPKIARGRGRRCAARRVAGDVLDRLLDEDRAHRGTGRRPERAVPRRPGRERTACGCAHRCRSSRPTPTTSTRTTSSCSPRPTARRIATPRSTRSPTVASTSTSPPAPTSSRSTSRACAARSSSVTTCASVTSSGRSPRRPTAMSCPRTGPRSGAHHWKTLLRARAIENQAYVVGVNRVGTGGRLHY